MQVEEMISMEVPMTGIHLGPPSHQQQQAEYESREDKKKRECKLFFSRMGVCAQSTESPPVSSALSFIGGIHIGARALHVLNLRGVGTLWWSPLSSVSI